MRDEIITYSFKNLDKVFEKSLAAVWLYPFIESIWKKQEETESKISKDQCVELSSEFSLFVMGRNHQRGSLEAGGRDCSKSSSSKYSEQRKLTRIGSKNLNLTN